MPRLAAVLLTYNRATYAEATIKAFYKYVTPKPHLHIADDGSPPATPVMYIDRLRAIAKEAGAPAVTVSRSDREGGQASYGHNYNLATQTTHEIADYLLMLEDDWELTRPLDLAAYVQDMDVILDLECVRMGYLSWTQPLWGNLVNGPNHKYVLLDANSPEPHVFAGHPRLEKVSYQREVGPWPEGLLPGQTEFAVAHNRRARFGVAWPLGLDAREGYGLFAHIGTERSY